MARKLLHSHMALLVPERDLPRTKAGAILKGGFFCAAKNASEDRLIYDRRPENSTMQKLDWLRLPSASCFRKRLLKPGQFLRGSGDDLRNYYYMLALPEDWICHNCVGIVYQPLSLKSSLTSRLGGERYFLCLRVLGMGDNNACDIAQATHEAVLQGKGFLSPEQVLKHGAPPPVRG